MRRLIYAATLSVFFSITVFGKWAWIPVDQLVSDSDLIVVGTLHSAVEDSSGIGKGYIRVERVITKGAITLSGASLKPGDNLKIEWADDWACAAGMHMGREGKQGVWLLKVEEDATVEAAYPGRFLDLEELGEVERLLRKREFKRSARVDILNQNSGVTGSETVYSEIIAEPIVTSTSPKPVDTTPFDEYSPSRALITLLFSTILYGILYRSRFRIR